MMLVKFLINIKLILFFLYMCLERVVNRKENKKDSQTTKRFVMASNEIYIQMT